MKTKRTRAAALLLALLLFAGCAKQPAQEEPPEEPAAEEAASAAETPQQTQPVTAVPETEAAGSKLEKQPARQTDGTGETDDAVFTSVRMNFSFLYDPAFTASETEGGAAVIRPSADAELPNYTVLYVAEGADANEYLEEQRFAAQMEYGEALVRDGGAPADIGAAGRTILGITYSYVEGQRVIEVASFAEDLASGGTAVYTASYYEGKDGGVVDGVTKAINTFQPDAGYYAGTSGVTGAALPQQSAGSYTLTDYDGGVFTMRLPEGWQIETGGAYAGFTFHAWDPQNPDVQIFYCGELGPYFKSAAGKQGYAAMSGGTDQLSALPVLDPATLTGCLSAMDSYEETYNSLMPTPFDVPDIRDLTVEQEDPVTTPLASLAISESVMRASLTSTTGAACTGIFQGSVADAGSYVLNGVDTAPSRCAMNVFGVIAPEGEFDAVAATLIESLSSFRFTEAYIQEGIAATDLLGQNAAERSRQNMAMMDEITARFCFYIRYY